jgi:hypothetical protein
LWARPGRVDGKSMTTCSPVVPVWVRGICSASAAPAPGAAPQPKRSPLPLLTSRPQHSKRRSPPGAHRLLLDQPYPFEGEISSLWSRASNGLVPDASWVVTLWVLSCEFFFMYAMNRIGRSYTLLDYSFSYFIITLGVRNLVGVLPGWDERWADLGGEGLDSWPPL